MPVSRKHSELFVWLVLLCLQFSIVELAELDSCEHNGQAGTCRGYSYCKDELQGQSFKICGENAREALVCCPNENSTQLRLEEDSGERISVQKCNEYRKLSYSQVVQGSLLPNAAVRVIEVPKCSNIVKLIYGGNVTKPGEFPHMAAIGWRNGNQREFNCGGTLISERFVLTAAHCYEERNKVFPNFVRLGDQNLVRTDDGARPRDVGIEEFIRHKAFKRSRGRYNDIALVKMKKEVQFNHFIRPACLYNRPEVTVKEAIATGFGQTEAATSSDELLKVSLSIYDNQVCQEGYVGIRQLPKGMHESQLCVGSDDGRRDTCQGDSGGPLQIAKQDAQCMFYVIGLTSLGHACGSTVPAIYTRVASFLDWIEPIVWG